MDINEQLSQGLKAEAIGLNLCKQWTEEWVNGLSKQDLIDRFVRGYDFCTKHDWPSNKFILDNFDEELRWQNNIYVDEEIDLVNEHGIVIIQGKSKGKIINTGIGSATIFIRHDSAINIGTGDVARLFIHVYDNAKVTIRQTMKSKVFVYKHSSKCSIITNGDVKIREKV